MSVSFVQVVWWRMRGNVPDSHARTRNGGKLDGARETLVTLRVIVLQADLEFDGLEEVSLLLIERVVKKLLHVCAHSGWDGSVKVIQRRSDSYAYRL
jgi:hypothetical protein